MIAKTIRAYSIHLTKAQVEAMRFAEAVSLQLCYAKKCDFDGEPEQSFLDENDLSAEQAKVEIAAAKASTLVGENVTFVVGSKLEGDVIERLEVMTEGENAIITGERRCQAIRSLVATIREASAKNSNDADTLIGK